METSFRMDARVLNVETLFGSDTSYRIPPFQRPYSWDEERQWKPLWDDIENLAKRRLSLSGTIRPHFMGAIVMQQRSTPVGVAATRLVIDGQQRLTTLQLAIRATAEVLNSRGMSDRANRLRTLTLNRKEYTGGNKDNFVKIRQTKRQRPKRIPSHYAGPSRRTGYPVQRREMLPILPRIYREILGRASPLKKSGSTRPG